jgi:hypothetical protein
MHDRFGNGSEEGRRRLRPHRTEERTVARNGACNRTQRWLVIFGEVPGPGNFAGMALILGSSIALVLEEKSRRSKSSGSKIMR